MRVVQKFFLVFILLLQLAQVQAQFTLDRQGNRDDRKAEKRKKINALIRQAEEGTLVYTKQSVFGFQARSNGYGILYELAKMKTPLKSMVYRAELTEIKHPKENRFQNLSNPFLFISNPYIYGKVNNFYQLSLGIGQQRLIGQKGNKNGVSVSWNYNGGLALGLLKPYYVQVEDPTGTDIKYIKYTKADSVLFLGPSILGAGGFWRGWNELKLNPGFFAKSSLRYDYGRFNEVVSALEIGCSVEYYPGGIPIMALQQEKPLFFQAYIALLFGRRK